MNIAALICPYCGCEELVENPGQSIARGQGDTDRLEGATCVSCNFEFYWIEEGE